MTPNPLVEFLWEEFRGVCESELLKAEQRMGARLPPEARMHLKTVPDEIAIRLIARCLDAIGQAKSDEERARTIEALIRTFGWGRPATAAALRPGDPHRTG